MGSINIMEVKKTLVERINEARIAWEKEWPLFEVLTEYGKKVNKGG